MGVARVPPPPPQYVKRMYRSPWFSQKNGVPPLNQLIAHINSLMAEVSGEVIYFQVISDPGGRPVCCMVALVEFPASYLKRWEAVSQ